MTPKTNKEKIVSLEKRIKYHRNLYYNEQPEISDAEYDVLEDELKALDPKNSLFLEVGADSSELFSKKPHIIPMGSLDKATKIGEFKKWGKKMNYSSFLAQFKLDGISIELQYKEGIFQRAVTRGDGKIGDDITKNVIRMKGFVPKLNDKFSGGTRAEIVMFHDVFQEKYPTKKNCRNAAGGVARRKDGKGCEDLNLIFIDAVSSTNAVSFANEITKLKWLQQQGFPTVKTKTLSSIQEVIDVRESVMNSIRDTLDYDIDGLVIKGKNIDLEDMKRARPMKQLAFKFDVVGIETTLIGVNWSMNGHNYTPVAKLESVQLYGGKLENPTLHNPNIMNELGIKIPCRVLVSKGGEIIPKVLKVTEILPNAKEVTIPAICEVCGTTVENTGSRVYCPNETCPKRLYHRIKKWIETLGIKNFGEEMFLKKLFASGRIQKIADLYSLEVRDLTKFERTGETSAKNALNNLYKVKEVTIAVFVDAFDIDNIGEELVQRVVDGGFDTIDKIKHASVSDMSRIKGLGKISSSNLINGVNKVYSDMLEVLSTNKIRIMEVIKTGSLKDLSFCFTGKLNNFESRSKAEEVVIKNGGTVKGSVTKDLSYLVTNFNDPTTKYKKAQSQENTKIISEKEFLMMVE